MPSSLPPRANLDLGRNVGQDGSRVTPALGRLSAHRAGALDEEFERSAGWCWPTSLILEGLPPVMCKRAEPETVARLPSMPVQVS